MVVSYLLLHRSSMIIQNTL